MFGCHLQKKNKGCATVADYKEKLASSFRRSVSFEGCADETPRQVSLGPKAAVDGLSALGFTAWDKVNKGLLQHLSCCTRLLMSCSALRCATLCCAVLWSRCAVLALRHVLCCAVLCCAVLCCAVLCCAVLC